MPRGTKVSKEAKRVKVAKALVAGRKQPEIAQETGISVPYVGELAREPETQALIQQILAPHRARLAKIAEQSIALVERATSVDVKQRDDRINGLCDRIVRLRQIIAERSTHPTSAKCPGGRTGLMSHTLKSVGSGPLATVVDEYELDTGLLQELREHERQLRDELNDFRPNMQAVQRACDLLELAQGGKRSDSPGGASAGNFTLVQIMNLLQLTGGEGNGGKCGR